jgi:hypothetical protein
VSGQPCVYRQRTWRHVTQSRRDKRHVLRPVARFRGGAAQQRPVGPEAAGCYGPCRQPPAVGNVSTPQPRHSVLTPNMAAVRHGDDLPRQRAGQSSVRIARAGASRRAALRDAAAVALSWANAITARSAALSLSRARKVGRPARRSRPCVGAGGAAHRAGSSVGSVLTARRRSRRAATPVGALVLGSHIGRGAAHARPPPRLVPVTCEPHSQTRRPGPRHSRSRQHLDTRRSNPIPGALDAQPAALVDPGHDPFAVHRPLLHEIQPAAAVVTIRSTDHCPGEH